MKKKILLLMNILRFYLILFIISFIFIYYIINNYYNGFIKQNKSYNHYSYFQYKQSEKLYIKSPVVFGFAGNYKWDKLALFVSSLRKSSYKGDFVLGISLNLYNELKPKIEEYNIKPIFIEDEWPFYSSKNTLFPIDRNVLNKCMIENRTYDCKWPIYRVSIMNCWLEIYGSKYSHIISSDVRDVVFQGNPFDWNFEDGMYLVDETKYNMTIQGEMYNRMWVEVYTKSKEVLSNKVLNSGTLIGTSNYFIPFIKQYSDFIKNNNTMTMEQGTLNYLYYTNYFENIKFYLNRNEKGIVYSLALDLTHFKRIVKLKITNETLYNEDGTYPLIVHQYNRDYNLTRKYQHRFLNVSD